MSAAALKRYCEERRCRRQGFRNPAELTKQLREKLPKRPERVVRHHPALPYAEAAKFMIRLAEAEGRQQPCCGSSY